MDFLKKSLPIFLGVLLMAGSVFAQVQQQQQQQQDIDEVTDEELENFVAVTQTFQEINADIQSQAEEILSEEENMDFQRFQEIMTLQQNPQMAQQADIEQPTEDEQAIIKGLQPQLQELGKEAEEKRVAAIEDEDLSMQRFQEIAQAIQSDPQMMQRVQKMMQDTVDEG